MSLQSDLAIAATGTRFRIFVLPPYAGADFAKEPETVVVSVPPARIQPGPADDRMAVRDADNKEPYGENDGPPYTGPVGPPVPPGADGHFDRIPTDSRAFLAATMYATVRRTLDIWEGYHGGPFVFPFALKFPRMELIPAVNWDNAQSGFGFLEFGFARAPDGTPDRTRPYCENFDVLSHEMGHTIIFSTVGYPSSNALTTAQYGGFHESAADLVALVAGLHFNLLLDHLLDSSHGNLFTVNELSRIGETAKSEQIRLAFNYEKMSTVSQEPHALSQPVTGALFDVLVEVFQKKLVGRGLISPELSARAMGPEGGMPDTAAVNAAFAQAYTGREAGFKSALLEARDYLGALLADVWSHLRADNFTYVKVGLAALAADVRLTGGTYGDTIRACFVWREIAFPPEHQALALHRVSEPRPRRQPAKKPVKKAEKKTKAKRKGRGKRKKPSRALSY